MNNTTDNTGAIIAGVIIGLILIVGVYYLFFAEPPLLNGNDNTPATSTSVF